MIAEILSTGDELRSGNLVDSNSAYIAQKLEEIGLEIVRHSCVGDSEESISNILLEIGERADIAVVTGGLGPTIDDLSAQDGIVIKTSAKTGKDVEKAFRTLTERMIEK